MRRAEKRYEDQGISAKSYRNPQSVIVEGCQEVFAEIGNQYLVGTVRRKFAEEKGIKSDGLPIKGCSRSG